MGLNSTPFVTYHEIDVAETDLIEDAWGFSSEFCDVIELLGQIKVDSPGCLTLSLIEKVRKQD